MPGLAPIGLIGPPMTFPGSMGGFGKPPPPPPPPEGNIIVVLLLLFKVTNI